MEPRADGLERRPRRKRVASSSERTTSSTPTGRAPAGPGRAGGDREL